MCLQQWPWAYEQTGCRTLFATVIRRDLAGAALSLIDGLSSAPEEGDPFAGGRARLARHDDLRIAYAIDDRHHRLIPLAAGDGPHVAGVARRRLRILTQPGPNVPQRDVMFVGAKRVDGAVTLAVRRAWEACHRPGEDGMMYLLDNRVAIVAALPRESLVGVYTSAADGGALVGAARTGPERTALYKLADRFSDR